ncbi:hypothetical protein CALVIDRAFT_557996 [Calocera viscosa TUFC12733]|uniref:Uncharacterized protein n=1 Tax=Calocera viscosa (strain TUFC12733) TaxID=1330018 RepID=A0A167HJ83_CALVF|nr:hypothetical protein CALVIDRAFT_557996 [Calocera viscosa TUFC12733]
MTAVVLNHDIFAMVLDEVIDRLDLYRTKELIDLAYTLRRVNQYADERLETISRLFLDIQSTDALFRLIRADVTNYDQHQSLVLRFNPYHSPINCERLLQLCATHDALRRIVLDIRLDNLRDINNPPWEWKMPASVHELAVIEGARWRHGQDCLDWVDSFFDNPDSLRLAACRVPHIDFFDRPNLATGIFLLSNSRYDSDARELRSLATFSIWPEESVGVIRLIFSEDLSSTRRQKLMGAVQYTVTNAAYIFEELTVDVRYNCALDWFADRIQDGTLWTLKGRLIGSEEQVNHQQDDDHANHDAHEHTEQEHTAHGHDEHEHDVSMNCNVQPAA